MDLIKKIFFERADWVIPAFEIGVRLYIFKVFFMSGLTKIQSWPSTLSLFEYEYAVPLIPHNIAAILGTGAELIFPILILLGFMTRPAAIGLFFLNATATYVYTQLDYFNLTGMADHMLWGGLLLVYIISGPMRLSLDNLIKEKFFKPSGE